MKYLIIDAVNKEWLADIEDKMMGLTNKTPICRFDQLVTREGTLVYVHTNEIRKDYGALWDTIENVVSYFNRIQNTVKQLD